MEKPLTAARRPARKNRKDVIYTAKSNLRIGYILRSQKEDKPFFILKESAYTRKITSRGDKVYSKILMMPVDYEEIEQTTNQIRYESIIIVNEPFFLVDNIYDKVIRWIAWANSADPREYDPFAE